MLYPNSSLSLWIDVFIICLAFAVISTALIFIIRFILNGSVTIFPQLWNRPVNVGSRDELMQNRGYKRIRFQPEKVITYGQNTFAYNSRKKKILIQTYMYPEGILLDYKDVISFEVLEKDDTSAETQCGELSLIIRTSKPEHEEITLKYISTPEDRSGFVYASASSAAKDVKAVLDGILATVY